MGIALQELMAMEFFSDFVVIAGRNGLQKEIQGITTMEAPDCFKWTKGKELVLSSGYVIMKEPGCLMKAYQEGSLQQISGLMIKTERYLEKIPQDVIDLFDMIDVPLITMPFAIAWMDLISQVNTAVMNRTIARLQIYNGSASTLSNQSYKDQKIKQILRTVEVEMNFPAFLYDISEDKSYYSSSNFSKITKQYGLKESDYWNPSIPFTRHILCDHINMARYRIVNQSTIVGPRVSWVIIPIITNNVTQAYFVVMESREFMDYYDEYSIRIAFLMLHGVYEQIMAAKNAGEIGFENFVHYALTCQEEDMPKLIYQAGSQGIPINANYITVLVKQITSDFRLRSNRKLISEVLQASPYIKHGKLAILDEAEALLLLDVMEYKNMSKEDVDTMLGDLCYRLAEKNPDVRLEFGVCREAKPLTKLSKSVEKCRLVMQRGRNIFPEKNIWDYEMLGPLTWLQIPEDELNNMLRDYRRLLVDEKNVELLKTLKVYLENNMNYSLTAEKMYVHINTIRKRIDKVREMININWDQHVERMKVELLLQYLELGSEGRKEG